MLPREGRRDYNEAVMIWHGGVAKRFTAPVLKTGISKGIMGSNPIPSADIKTTKSPSNVD